MGEELDSAIIQKTQESLGKIIKKPTLTEKLLRKPPFKFLHDILTSVISTTGFLEGVYTDEELLSENIKERDSKIAFLQKAIDHVVLVTGEPLKIRPTKTVAGHEADKTNEFLQALSKAVLLTNNNALSSPVIKSKSSTKSSTKKSEKMDSNENKKLDSKEKQKKTSTGEPLKVSSNSRSTDKAKQEKTSKADSQKVGRNHGKSSDLKESSRKSDLESGKKSSSSKPTIKDIKGKEKEKTKNNESNEKERSKSRERSQNKIKSKSTSEDKNKIRRESRDTDRSINKNAAKDLKKISKRSSPEKKISSSASPKKSPEKKKVEEVDEDINDLQQVNENLEPEAVLLGSTQIINGEIEPLPSERIHKSSSEAPAARTLSGRPPTGLPSHSKNMEGAAPNSTEESMAAHETQLGQIGEPDKEKRPSTSTIRRASARPPTARPAAPRVRVVNAAPDEAPSQETTKPVSNIIMDGAEAPDNDEDDNFVVKEPAADEASEDTLVKNGTHIKDLEGKTHGSLVTQIIATSKDLENGSRRPGTGFKRVELDKSLLSDTSRRKDRELFVREMDKLRESVQTLTKSANPLGKLIDYLQEDVDTMFREFEMWSAERRRHEIALQKEESKADLNLESLQNSLQEVEEKIEDQMAKISAIKANIIRNEERVQKMVTATRM